jgi:glycosyltransferase involved in cell wall biosynthesis
MRVGISLLTFAPGDLGGVETYARALARALAGVGTLEYRALVPAHAADAAGGLPSVPVQALLGARSGPRRIPAMMLSAALSPRLRGELRDLDVVHYPLTVPVPRTKARQVVTLQDIQHLDLPHHFSGARLRFRRWAYDDVARRAVAVIVTSEFVRRSAVERLGLKESRVHVIPLGVNHALFSPGGETRETFLLYPARPWPHKNHARLLEAFVLLRGELPQLRLVLTGGGLEVLGALPEGVDRVGSVSVEELASLYRTAACLVFPSLYEGFGLPPLEAMAAGCPVAAGNVGAVPEVCGEAAVYFDPTDPAAIANGIREALALADELRELGIARAAEYSWEKTALAHETVYRSVASGASAGTSTTS